MKVLIYGAGVIGSLYAVLFSEAGADVTIYARSGRLEYLRQNGLLYKKDGQIKKAEVRVISEVDADELYDFILLSVRENQLRKALSELKTQKSPTIVTMVNTIEPYSELEKYCGEGRLLPAFPGAGGGFEDGVLDAGLTPRIVQPTTFGEIGGAKTERAKQLARLFKKSGVPYQIVKDMHDWQLSHLGMVVPIADAYYASDCPEKVYLDKKIMRETGAAIKQNFKWLAKRKRLSPAKFYLVTAAPVGLIGLILKYVYKSDFGYRFMYCHAIKAPDEMAQLHREFYGYIKENSQKSKVSA